jgi:hypothetical protein
MVDQHVCQRCVARCGHRWVWRGGGAGWGLLWRRQHWQRRRSQ